MGTTKTTVRSSKSTSIDPGAGALGGISDRKLLSGIRKLSSIERKTDLER